MQKPSIFLLLLVFFLISPTTIVAQETEELKIESEAAVLMDAETGQILYGKQATKKMYPASITKIATAIYALEKGNLHDLVTVSEQATDVIGTRVYLEPGEVVTLEKLLIGMLVNSGNDAAYAIAEHLDGSIADFSRNINHFLREKVGVTNTNFTNPHGLFDENHYTTPRDMGLITRYAMNNEQFMEYFQIQEYEWDGLTWQTTLHNHHRLVKGEFVFEGITGGKNGFVNESGHTLVTTAERDGQALIVVTMNALDRNTPYYDTMQLLEYGFQHFEKRIIPEGTILRENGEEYLVSEDLVYWEPVDAAIQQEISSTGLFRIKDQTGQILVTYELIPKTPEQAEEASSAAVGHHDVQLSQQGSLKRILATAGATFAIVWTGILLWRRKVAKKKQMAIGHQIIIKADRK